METPTIRSEETQLLLKMNNQDAAQDTLELRLGLPGSDTSSEDNKAVLSNNNKRPYSQTSCTSEDVTPSSSSSSSSSSSPSQDAPPPPKAQVMGWPPIRSYRRNCIQAATNKKKAAESVMYVKVSMDGAPYLRKIDLKGCNGYKELLKALEELFQLTTGKLGGGYIDGSEFAPTYEDKDGDWMLLGDVPWEMFVGTCNRLRIMKGTEARGLGCTTAGSLK